MARTRIYTQEGKRTPFFWRDKDGRDPSRKIVYKSTRDGVVRMRGVHFNVNTGEFVKE